MCIRDRYCATYDLYTGKRIQFSDLFFEGEDYGAELYEFMKGKIAPDIICLLYTSRCV